MIGRNKLIINHLGRLFVTSDAATIIREIEVAHPAAKLLVMASTAQETEVSVQPRPSTPLLRINARCHDLVERPTLWLDS
jgi:hypothetical protein